jgi:hypothetical protein
MICSDSGAKIGEGSGFFISKDGKCITNNHVLSGAENVMIRLQDGTEIKDLKINDFSEEKDIVCFQTQSNPNHYLKLGDSNTVNEGDPIFVCGNSLGEYSNSITTGIISAIRYNEKGYKYFQISAAISPGNSGGPVCLEDGTVIGIATASNVNGQNLNFAVPINYAKGMLDTRKNLSLEKYSSLSMVGGKHIIISEKEESDYVHPDTDINKRVVILPFTGFSQFEGDVGEKIQESLILRFKANFGEEKIYIEDMNTVREVLNTTSGDKYDKILTKLSKEDIRKIALKLRANTVVHGHVNHYQCGVIQKYVLYLGMVSVIEGKFNIDYGFYKLDRDEDIVKGNFRRTQEFKSIYDGMHKVGSFIIGAFKDKFGEFNKSNKYQNNKVKVKLDKGDFKVIPVSN